jgi:2-amino-4-hydroxy-6-hydroxymethyldihydropteridine diphosphokinase
MRLAMKTVYLGLGSNLGDRVKNLRRAIEALGARGVRVTRESSIYETEPLEVREQPWFLNCVVEAETDLMPRQLIQALLEIERDLGRRRRVPKGPRLIDMDILLFGTSTMSAPELEIPHPRMAQRKFVLLPLAEIAASVRHPITKLTIAEMLAETPDRSEVRVWKPEKAARKT